MEPFHATGGGCGFPPSCADAPYRGGVRDEASYDEDRGDPDLEPAPPSWFPGGHLPEDARRMGLTHHVAEGALLDFAGRLDGAKPLHRFTAWALLVVFGLPVVFAMMRLFNAMAGT
jgi:hypothetical protein